MTEGASASYTGGDGDGGRHGRHRPERDENTLTFSTTNWNTAQPVEVTAGQDDDAVEDTATLTRHRAATTTRSKDLPVTVTDNDTPELMLSKSELAVTEGASASYTVKLATQPTGQVTVTVGGMTGTALSVTENTLTFSITDWNTAQPVEVTAGQDDDAVEDTATLTHTVTVSKGGDSDGQRYTGAGAVEVRAGGDRGSERELHGEAGDATDRSGDGDRWAARPAPT